MSTTPTGQSGKARNSAGTRQPSSSRRIDNLLAIVRELAYRDMTIADVGALLGFSDSGARNYIRELSDAGLMEISARISKMAGHAGQPVFTLTQDSVAIDSFLEAMAERKRLGWVAPRSAEPLPVRRGSRFHLLDGDSSFVPTERVRCAARDPLVAALFGAAPIR